MTLKTMLQDITPPVIRSAVSYLKRFLPFRSVLRNNPVTISFDGDYATWEEAVRASAGYSAGNILEITRTAMAKVRDGGAIYERDSVLFDKPEYPYPLLAGLMRVALESGQLNVLDFGGALGSTFFQCRSFLSPVKDLRWSIVEQPGHVISGQAEFTNEHLHFYHTVEECLDSEKPNIIVLSSVLQYLPKPYETLLQLLALQISNILIDRTAFVVGERDRLTVQTVPESIYLASYPAWFFCEATFSRSLIDAGYRIVDAFAGSDHVALDEGKSYFKGFILQLDS
jgi:putative methyltransferase (TIGR04325 family)